MLLASIGSSKAWAMALKESITSLLAFNAATSWRIISRTVGNPFSVTVVKSKTFTFSNFSSMLNPKTLDIFWKMTSLLSAKETYIPFSP